MAEPTPCPTPSDPSESFVDCDGDPAVPPGAAYEVVDTFSGFGDNSLDECSVYLTDPAYTVVEELTDGCCECPCVPSGTDRLVATVSSDGACWWNRSIDLFLVTPRASPTDTVCWRGTLVGDNGCTVVVVLCCNCNGVKTLSVGTEGPSLCVEGCCTVDATCVPLVVKGKFCCHWFEGTGPGTIDCGSCCVEVTVTL